MTEIMIYTDGSCQTQTRIGGWAAVLTSGTHRKALSRSVAELIALHPGLAAVVGLIGVAALQPVHTFAAPTLPLVT